MDELVRLNAGDLAAAIRTRKLSSQEVTKAVLARLEVVEPALNAFITVAAEQALEAAADADAAVAAGASLGPLHGVPFSVKDLLNTAQVRTTFASLGFADNVPTADCVAVARLKRAGAILIGKTTTPEFGHKPLTEAPLFGRTLNPWDSSRTPGGSSGGAAAAVAAGVGPLALGTDGGGSIRIPAAACGIVGMKQTLGLVPHDQAVDAFGLLAYIGPMTRTVGDAAALLAAMAGPHPSDPHSLGRWLDGVAEAGHAEGDLDGRVIGYRTYLGNARIDSEVQAHFETCLETFAALGAELEEVPGEFPASLPYWAPLTFSIWASRFTALEAELGDKMSASLRHWMGEGRGISAVAVQEAMAFRTRLYRLVEAWFERYDLVLTPTLARTAVAADHDPLGQIEIEGVPAGGLRDGWYPYTHPFNLTGHPAITVPAGWASDGLPTGLQIVGPWFGDREILRAAALFERERPWQDRWPTIEAA